jgi:hypothetical protein
MPQLLLRAIITGFGYKLGTELGRYIIDRLGRNKKEAPAPAATESDLPEGIPADPSVPLRPTGTRD